MSFLRERSPVTPNMTRTQGPATRGNLRSEGSRNGLMRSPRSPLVALVVLSDAFRPATSPVLPGDVVRNRHSTCPTVAGRTTSDRVQRRADAERPAGRLTMRTSAARKPKVVKTAHPRRSPLHGCVVSSSGRSTFLDSEGHREQPDDARGDGASLSTS